MKQGAFLFRFEMEQKGALFFYILKLCSKLCAGHFRGGPDRQIHEPDKVLRIFFPHFLKEQDVAVFCVFVDMMNMVTALLRQGNIDLTSVSGGTAALNVFFPVKTAENIGDPSGRYPHPGGKFSR